MKTMACLCRWIFGAPKPILLESKCHCRTSSPQNKIYGVQVPSRSGPLLLSAAAAKGLVSFPWKLLHFVLRLFGKIIHFDLSMKRLDYLSINYRLWFVCSLVRFGARPYRVGGVKEHALSPRKVPMNFQSRR